MGPEAPGSMNGNSMVVSARDAEGTIGVRLDAALAQDCPGDIGLIVGDGTYEPDVTRPPPRSRPAARSALPR